MIRLLGNGRTPIGIAIDGRWIKAAQLARRLGGWRLAAAVRLPRTTPDAELAGPEIGQVARLLARQGFIGRRVVVALPHEKMLTGMLDLPPRSSGAPVDEIAAAELGRMHGFDPASAEVACWDLPPSTRSGDTTQAMAAACRHADAEAILDLFEGEGLEVAALDSSVHALSRACLPNLSGAGISAIVDLAWARVTLCLLHEGKIVYQRIMSEGAIRTLHEKVATRLHLDSGSTDHVLTEVGLADREQQRGETASLRSLRLAIQRHLDKIVSELEAPLSYAAGLYEGTSVDCLLLTGEGACIAGAVEPFRSRLDFRVRVAAPADVVACPAHLASRAGDPALTLAVGLAEFFE